MNTGLQDAYNLAWKLALVAGGRAEAALLDSYEDERIPVAERLLRTTDRAFSLIVSDSWFAGFFRTRIQARMLAFAMTFEGIRTLAFRTISQTGIRYARSPLSKTLKELPQGAPRAGDRFPWLLLKFEADGAPQDVFERLNDTCFNLILIGQPTPAGGAAPASELLRVHVVPDDPANERALTRLRIRGPAFYLLRPDGHVGLAGTRLEADVVTRYLSAYGIRAP
jgi:hypothetical protein